MLRFCYVFRSGHACPTVIRSMKSGNLAFGLDHVHSLPNASNPHTCEICVRGKMTRDAVRKPSNGKSPKPQPYVPPQRRNKTAPGQRVHCDIVDMGTNSRSVNGYRYFLTFMDDYSRYIKAYLLRSRDECESKYRYLKKWFQVQCPDWEIMELRTDGEGSFRSIDFKGYLESTGAQLPMTQRDNIQSL